MILRKLLTILLGGTYGFLSAAGVFTVLLAVGLVPRFAGRTHTANKVYLYEEMVIWGTILGCFVSVFEDRCGLAQWLCQAYPEIAGLWRKIGGGLLIVIGVFCGIFVGCLALAIAEMLDSLPIFARRISFRKGLPYCITAMALGKLVGGILYFWTELYRTAD